MSELYWESQVERMKDCLEAARNPLGYYDHDFRYLADQVEERYEVFIDKISEEVWNSQKNRD